MKASRPWLGLLMAFLQYSLLAQVRNPLVLEDEEKMRHRTVYISDGTIDPERKSEPPAIGTLVTQSPKTKRGQPADQPRGYFGAGIIAGTRGTTVYIVTAQHVVARIRKLAVRFYKEDKDDLARIMYKGPENSEKIEDDLAVICVDNKTFANPLPMLGSGQATYDTDVYVLGHPNRNEWEISAKPDAVTAVKGAALIFQSAIVAQGDSGGPLLGNSLRLLVGMVVADQPPHGIAISSSYLATKMKDWDVPFDFPRGDSNPIWPFK